MSATSVVWGIVCAVLSAVVYELDGAASRTLVLGGGIYNINTTHFYPTIIDLAGGINIAKIGVIVAAASDPAASCKLYTDIFVNIHHARSVYCLPISSIDSSRNSDPAVLGQIRQQTGFYFAGGEPERITDAFYLRNRVPSPALLAIKDMYNTGTVVSGSSAGQECMSSAVMMWGGTGNSYDTLKYGPYEIHASNNRAYMLYDQRGGLGFIDGFIMDAHFSQKGRQGRLIRVLHETQRLPNGVQWGIGIDEDAGLVIRNVGTDQAVAEVIGENGVTFMDISKSVIDMKHFYFAIENVLLHYLTDGDRMFLGNKSIEFSPTKTPMLGHERFPTPLNSNDIFNSKTPVTSRKPEFVKVATSAFDAVDHHSGYGDTPEKHPTFRVVFSRAIDGSAGYSKRGRTFDEDVTSYTNLHLHMTGFNTIGIHR